MELTTLGMLGLGFCGGVLFALLILDNFYRPLNERKIDAQAKQYVYILSCFGIRKESDGVWRMRPRDRDEIWVKKEEV